MSSIQFYSLILATSRIKRASPNIHQHQRPSGSNMYDMNDEMMYPGPSSSGDRNHTPHSRHRADEGL